jgi:hypothetical protein
VRSRNLENEEAKARHQAVKIKPQWVVKQKKKKKKTVRPGRNGIELRTKSLLENGLAVVFIQ